MGKYDGKVVISTALDNSDIGKDVREISGEFGGLKTVAQSASASISKAFAGNFSKAIAAAQARVNDLTRQLETASVALKDAMLANDDIAAERAGNKQIRIYDQLEAAREKLRIAVEEEARKQAGAERKESQKSAKETRAVFDAAGKSARRFGSRLREIVSGAFVFNIISRGLRSVTDYFGSALKTNSAFTKEVAKLKAALLTAFQPIYSYVVPALTSLIRLLTSAMQKVAAFLAALSGKSLKDVTKSAENMYKEAESINSVGSAAKKAEKSLAGFDEINTLQNPNAQGGSVSNDITPDFSLTGDENLNGGAFGEVSNKIKEILDYLPAIAAGFAGIKLGGFIADLLTANTQAKTLKETIALLGKKAGLTLGITLAITGIALETKGIISTFQEGLNGINFAEILGGGGMLAGGGALIGQFFGRAVLGGAIGGIVAGVPAFIAGVYDSLVNGIDWLSAALTAVGGAAAGAGVAAILTALGTTVAPGIGTLIGLAVGLVTDLIILIVQKWDEICAFFATAAEWFDANVIQPVGEFFSGLWASISQWASDAWEGIKNFFTPAVEWFSELFSSIWQTVSDVFYNIGVIASGCWEIIKAVWGFVSGWFNKNVVQPVSDFFTGLWNGFIEKAKAAWMGVKTIFGGVASFFKDIFTEAWSKVVGVFSVAGEIFVNIKDAIVSAFKTVVNGIIRGLNSVIAVPFNGINKALQLVKGIEILGLQPFSGLKTISVPKIPLLAQGAVLPANKPFLAMVGDQKHGTNIEAPLETIKQALSEVLSAQGGSNGDININFTGDLAQLARVLKPVIDRENRRVGGELIRSTNNG